MVAQLHHERISHSEATPERWMLLTHGIYGAGMNWRGIARQLVARRRDWGVILVDLRLHGRSGAGEPPHDLAACAADLVALAGEVGPIAALAGHSFGGKVMLAARDRIAVEQTWMLDSSPGVASAALIANHGAGQVLALLEDLPRVWISRDAFVAALVKHGQSEVLARWLAMNLAVQPNGAYVVKLDLAAMRSLLADYAKQDLWQSAFDPSRGALHIVIAEQSNTIDAAARARLATAPPHVHVHWIAAGHWLNVEAPGAVTDLFVSAL